jgi:hypothetical protein
MIATIVTAAKGSLDPRCFSFCSNLATVHFELNCRISTLGEEAFANCSSLESICMRSSVEIIWKFCFARCQNLSTRFESNCQGSTIGE